MMVVKVANSFVAQRSRDFATKGHPHFATQFVQVILIWFEAYWLQEKYMQIDAKCQNV